MSEELKGLHESGKPQEVLNRFTQIKKKGDWETLTDEEQIACIYYRCRSLFWLGRFEEALQTASAALLTYSTLPNRSYLLALLAAKFHVLRILLQWDEAQKIITNGTALLMTLTDQDRRTGAVWIAQFEYTKGLGLSLQGEFERARDTFQSALKMFEAFDDRYSIAECISRIADAYYYEGDLERAWQSYQESIVLYQALENKFSIGECLHKFGLIQTGMGELDIALEYFKQSQQLAKENNDPVHFYWSLNHSGDIYTAKGDPNKALDYFRQSLAAAESSGLDWAIASDFWYIGKAYHQKGAFAIALPFFQSSLAKFEQMKNDWNIARVLFSLVLLRLDQQDYLQAQEHLNTLQKVTKRIPGDPHAAQLRFRLAQALVFKHSSRMKEKLRAQPFLQQIVDEDFFFGFTVLAMVALCDLLLLELKATGEQEVWEEAKNLIDKCYSKAQEARAYPVMVQALLLKSKFASIDGLLDEAQKYFDEAGRIVHDQKLDSLSKKVKIEQRNFEAELEKWQALMQRHSSLKERLEQAQLAKYIQEVQRTVNQGRLAD
ncbi:MAG: tetratricopeptide repeat protein [Candidatus Heimdallarchaeota archaeon]